MSSEKDELVDQSDALLRAVEDVRSLERRKRSQDISTPAFHELADRIEERSRDVFRIAHREEILGDALETTDESIEEAAKG